MSMSPSPPPINRSAGSVPRGRPVCDSLPHYSSCCVGPLATDASNSWTCQYCKRRYSGDVSGGYTKRVVSTDGKAGGGGGGGGLAAGRGVPPVISSSIPPLA